MAEGRPRTLQNAAATLIGRGAGQFTRLLALFVMRAHLSPAQWGLLAILFSALEVARGLTNFGLDTAAVRWMALHPGAEGRLQRLLLKVKTGLATVGVLCLAGYLWATKVGGAPELSFLILPFALFPMGWTASLAARFQSRHMMHWLIPVEAASGGFYLLAVHLAARLAVPLGWFIGLAVAVECFSLVATAIAARLAWGSARQTEDGPLPVSWKDFFSEGLPLGLLNIIVILYMRLGMFLVNSKGGGEVEAGNLYAAIKMNEYTVAFAGALASSALPVFSRLYQEGKPREIRRTFMKYSLMGAGVSVSAALFLTLFGGFILALKSQESANAAAPLAVLTWAGVAMFQNNLSACVLYAFGLYRYVTAWACVTLTIYFFLCSFLAPRYHAVGAAGATVITETIASLVYLVLAFWVLRRAERERKASELDSLLHRTSAVV